MATVYNPILDEQKDEKSQINQPEDQSAPAAPSAAPSAGSSSSSIPASAGSSGAAPASGKPSKSGQFTNIQNYIQGNRQGAQKLGQDVAEKVGNKVQSGLTGIQTSSQNAMGEAQATTDNLKAQQAAGQQAIQSLTSGQDATDLAGLESTAATSLSDQYKTDLDNTQFKDLANLQNKGTELSELGDQTRTSAGRQAILARNFARPDYTTGQSAFDSLLLGGSKEALQGLSKARQAVGQYNPNLQAATDQYNTFKDAATTDITAKNEALKAQVAQATSQDATANPNQSLYAQLKSRADALNTSRSANTASMNDAERIKALQAAGYDVKTPNDMLKIVNGDVGDVAISVKDLLANPALFQETFQQAGVNNVDPATLARLNVLNRLGGTAEIADSGLADTGIQRGFSTAGTNALKDAKAALKGQGLDSVQKVELTSKDVDSNAVKDLSKGTLYNNPDGVKNATAMLTNLSLMPASQVGEILTRAGIPADNKSAANLLQEMISNIQQGPARNWGGNQGNIVRNAVTDAKIIAAIAQQQTDYNAKQTAIQSVLDKYLRGIK